MARNDRIARLFKLMEALARARRGVVLRTFAESEGENLRSLYRDIEALELAGFPVVHEDGRYRFIEAWLPAARLGVDGEELLALFLARDLAAGWRGARVGDALERLYRKLAAPTRGSGSLLPLNLGDGFSLAQPTARDYGAYRTTVASLDRAIRERRVVQAVYESLAGEVTTRSLEPAQLHWDARLEALYLIAWCRLRADLRIFATHRFRAVSAGAETFAPRPGVTTQNALRAAFRVWREERATPVRLRFTGRAARLVAERRWHSAQRTRKEPGGALLFEAEVAGTHEITPWILSFGPDCEVLEPAALRVRVRDAHAQAAALATDRPPAARARRLS